MEKKIYFLVSLNRSGNTILSSILNQNKEIAVTPNSIIPEILSSVYFLKTTLTYKNFKDEKSFNNVINNIRNNYYSSWPQKFIIERSFIADELNLGLTKQTINNEFKGIVLVRPILETISSWIKLINENNIGIEYAKKYTKEEKLDLFIGDKNNLLLRIKQIKFLIKKFNFLVVEYKDLIINPNETILKIYKYLNIPNFNHDFTKIEQFNINGLQYIDSNVIDNLHLLKDNKLEMTQHDFTKIPKNILETFKQHNEYWKE